MSPTDVQPAEENAEDLLRSAVVDGRFSSLKDLRVVHTEFLARLDAVGPEDPSLLDAVQRMNDLGMATGAVLDESPERREAQSLLDFWENVLYRGGRPMKSVRLAAFDEAELPALADSACPFLGLSSFDEAENDRFYGRSDLLDALLQVIGTSPLLAVIGPSGSGKSSVVCAGLIPALRSGRRLEGSQSWLVLPTVLPGSDPLGSLAAAVVSAWEPNWPGADAGAETPGEALTEAELVRAMRAGGDGLAAALRPLGGRPVLVVVDQFEEVFTICSQPHDAKAFIDNLLGLIATGPEADLKNRVVLTMRSDFEVFIMRYEEIQERVNSGRVFVKPMDHDGLRAAIEEPAKKAGLVFERGVVDKLIQDTFGEIGTLPLLQFTLLNLWKNRRRNKVTMAAYRRLGGARLALANVADALFQGMAIEDQEAVKRIFLRMVRPGEGLEVTNRRIRRSELFPRGEDHGKTGKVLKRLVDEGLVRETHGARQEDAQVEVAHEALVRNWPTLIGWLNEERAAIVNRQRLEAKVIEWVGYGRGDEALLDESQIAEAETFRRSKAALLLGAIPELDNLIEASRSAIESRQKELEGWRRYALFWGLVTAVLVVIAVGWLIWAQADRVRTELVVNLLFKAEQVESIHPGDIELRSLLATEAVGRASGKGSMEARQVFFDILGSRLPLPIHSIGTSGVVTQVAVSSDGRHIATATETGTVNLYGTDEWTRVGPDISVPGVSSLAFSPDGRRLLATTFDPAVLANLLKPASGQNSAMPFASPASSTLPPGSQSLIAKESSDKSTVGASGRGAASSVHIFEVGPSGLTPANWEPFAVPSLPASAMISADGTRLYCAAWDGALYATRMSANPSDPCLEKVWSPVGSHVPNVPPLFSPDGRFFLDQAQPAPNASTQWNTNHVLRVLPDLATSHDSKEGVMPFYDYGSLPAQSLFSPAGQLVMLAGAYQTVVWGYKLNKDGGPELVLFKPFPALTANELILALSPDGRYLATSSIPPSAPVKPEFMDSPGNRSSAVQVLQRVYPFVPAGGASRQLPRSGGWLLSEAETTIRVYDLQARRFVASANHSQPVTDVKFDTLGHLVTAGRDQLIKVWPMQAGVETAKEVKPGKLEAATFSPDARLVAETSLDPDAAPGHPRPDASGATVVSPARVGQSETKAVDPSPAAVTDAINAPPPKWRVRVRQVAEPPDLKTLPGTGLAEPLSNQEVTGWDSPTPLRSLVFSPDGDHLLAVGRPFFMTYELPAVTFVKQGTYPYAMQSPRDSPGQAPPGLTGDAQRFVLKLCDIRSGGSQFLKDPQGPTAAAAVAPGGTQVAVSTWGASTTLLDLEAGTKGVTFNTNGPLSVVLSRDGGRAALIDWDHTVKLFVSTSPKVCATSPPNTGQVRAMSFSPDGSRLAIASNKELPGVKTPAGSNLNQVRVVETTGGGTIDSFEVKDAPVRFLSSISFNNDGSRVAVVSGGTVVVRDSRQQKTVIHQDLPQAIEALSLDYDAKTGHLVDRDPGRIRQTSSSSPPKTPDKIVGHFGLSPNGKYLAASNVSVLVIRDAMSGAQLGVIGIAGFMYSIGFSPRGSFLSVATSYGGGEVRVYTVPELHYVTKVPVRYAWGTLYRFNAEETFVTSVGAQSVTEIPLRRLTPTGTRLEPLQREQIFRHLEKVNHSLPALDASNRFISPDQRKTALLDYLTRRDGLSTRKPLQESTGVKFGELSQEDRKLVELMIDLLIGRNPAPLPNPGAKSLKLPPGVQPLALSPDGHFVTVQGPDDFHRIEVATGKVMGSVRRPLDNLSVASTSDDSRIVAVSTLTATTQVFQPARTLAVVPVNPNEPVYALAFSAGGDYLAAGSLLNRLLLYPTASLGGKVTSPPRILDHGAPVTGVFFSPGDRYLASVAADNVIRVWALDNLRASGGGSLPARFELQADSKVTSVAFSHGGDMLAAILGDRTLRVWDLSVIEPRKKPEPAHDKGPDVRIPLDGTPVAMAFGADDQTILELSEAVARLSSSEPTVSLNVIPWGQTELYDLANARVSRNFSKAEWDDYFSGMPYRETIRRVGKGGRFEPGIPADVDWTMFSGFWKQFPLVVVLFLAVAGMFLFVIPTPRLCKRMVWWKLVLLALGLVAAGLIWAWFTVPLVWYDAFKLPNWLEKLTIVLSLVVVASLCISARQRLAAYLPPVGTLKPLDAFSYWWSFRAKPWLKRKLTRSVDPGPRDVG